MAKVFSMDRASLMKLCPASDFRTVPVQVTEEEGDLRCGNIKYPFSAGLVRLSQKKGDKSVLTAAAELLSGAPSRSPEARVEESQKLNQIAGVECMFMSAPTKYDIKSLPGDVDTGPGAAFGTLPRSDEHIEQLNVLNLEEIVLIGIAVCGDASRLVNEIQQSTIARQKIEKESHGVNVEQLSDYRDDVARGRREEVWNDAMREAAISGDRLYAFVRQLSGTIHEQVDAVCVVDESMLVQQQRDKQANMKRLSVLASQQHMQLVSTVFRSVIGESGLTLGIDNTGLDGDLKVVSNNLRKQVAELASGKGNDGFFANSVRLENLLAQGTGEMTLTGLFEHLRDVGMALQSAASYGSDAGMSLDAPSLDFLSSPRNSLLLRYKPETHAALRQAFDTFSREMMSRHVAGGYYAHRKISAFELIEGRDDELCMAFATFSAHVLAHQRMFSVSQAAYLGQWASRANVAAMHFTLNKLISVACRYLSNTERPRFLADNGWDRYFK